MTQKNAQKTAARARQAKLGGNYAAHRRVIGGGGTTAPTGWTCTQCGKAIDAGTGHILVKDAEKGGYPRKATSIESVLTQAAIEERRRLGKPTEPPYGGLGLYMNELEPIRPQIAFDAVHSACDPNPGSDEYWFHVERADTLEAWCRWVHHLTEKEWMGTIDVRAMLAFWFENRGLHLFDS